MYNLHNHTNFSDGKLSPLELLNLAVKNQLSGIAITDHDTIEGISVAREFVEKDKLTIDFIPGVEISAKYEDQDFVDYIKFKTNKRFPEIHILGLNIDINNPTLKESLEDMLNKRKEAGFLMVENLRNAGYNIFPNDEHKKEKFIGRVKIALELKRIGVVEDISEAFKKFIGNDAPYYIKRKVLNCKEAIDLINISGGIASLAHPGEIGNKEVFKKIIEEPLNAIECFHPKNSEELTDKLIKIARDKDFIISGGSDFHGYEKDDYTNFKLYGVEKWK